MIQLFQLKRSNSNTFIFIFELLMY